jgi:protein gp37
MPLKRSAGNMYPWVTHTHSHLAGACPHACSYCYVQAMARRFPEMKARYSGTVRLIEEEFSVAYGRGRTIFVEHLNDLFAAAVPAQFLVRILDHCRAWPRNTYVFQTKNPDRYLEFIDRLPAGSILGTTIETNRRLPTQVLGDAPQPFDRLEPMTRLPPQFRRFVTAEPIIDFDTDELASWLGWFSPPDFVNIGADSKGHGLPEPPAEKVRALIAALKSAGIEVRQKHNLERLLGAESQR